MTTMMSRIIHLSIDSPWKEVYAFASNPAKMPSWAAGLASGLTQDGNEWIASGPLGDARVKFSDANELGVIDHVVTLPNDLKVYNALRVTPNGDGAEVAFTLLRQAAMSDEEFQRDADAVFADLKKLKRILEE